MDEHQGIASLIETGRRFDRRGWVPATGGNFSTRVAPDRVVVTGSGLHKAFLTPQDFIPMDLQGNCLAPGRPSYETGLHLQVYRQLPGAGAVLHVHSIADTVLSRRRRTVRLQGYELLKTLPGTPDPESAVELPVFENDQDIARLARTVQHAMDETPELPAYLIRGHGLYAWGADPLQARYRVEALEFMFECEVCELRMGS